MRRLTYCRRNAATYAEEGAQSDLGPESHLRRVRRDDESSLYWADNWTKNKPWNP